MTNGTEPSVGIRSDAIIGDEVLDVTGNESRIPQSQSNAIKRFEISGNRRFQRHGEKDTGSP
jgi:hypothetical protein